MDKVILHKIALENFRIFKQREVEFSPGCNLITGKNGSGKTTLLEAASLLLPGRGMRRSMMPDMARRSSEQQAAGWRLDYLIDSKIGKAQLKSSYDINKKSREVFFSDKKIPSNDLVKFANLIWLTPQMDNLFLASSSERRRFFDRMVFHFFAQHATHYTKYEYFMRTRFKALLERSPQAAIEYAEQKMALYGAQIALRRVELSEKLQIELDKMQLDLPKIKIIFSKDDVEHNLIEQGFSEQELQNYIKDRLQKMRGDDIMGGKTNFGVHRTNFTAIDLRSAREAKFCSTGEQKSILIALILAQIIHASNSSLFQPVVLLDEIFVHLDKAREAALADFLSGLSAQIIITACENDGLGKLLKNVNILEISNEQN